MKERPILFSGEMVRAILDGRKTQTRRVVKLPKWSTQDFADFDAEEFPPSAIASDTGCFAQVSCPYGSVGDRLWVRERMRVLDILTSFDNRPKEAPLIRVRYESDGTESEYLPYPDRLQGTPTPGKCLAYGGYREVSRINLEITDIRVERLQDISEADAWCEGCPDVVPHGYPKSVAWFYNLWNKINGKKHPWESNPWLWVISFQKA